MDVPLQLVKGLVIAVAVCFVHYFGMTAATYHYSTADERISWYHWSNDEVRIGEFWITVVVTIFQLLLDLVLEVHERRHERNKAKETGEMVGAMQPQAQWPASGTLLGSMAALAATAKGPEGKAGEQAYVLVPASTNFKDKQPPAPRSAVTAIMGG
uniref:Uncharacterized protein n=1 Tax=Alexandrium andersonii TaxID=327968 RepID=A0A7S2ARW0_9DINO